MNEWYESRHGPCVVCLPHRTQLLTLALDPAAFGVEADLAATRFARSLRQRGLPIIGRRKSWAVSLANAAMWNYVSITKEAVGLRLTRSPFGGGTPRKLPLRVS